MTTVTPFTPSSTALFQFQPTLDGQAYTAITTTNLFGQRYYINLYATDGTWIFTQPLIGSPSAIALEAVSWANGSAIATTSLPHGYAIGSAINLTISGCAPDAYNGRVQALVIDAVTLSWPLPAPQMVASQLGGVSYDIDMAAGYFQTSTLVFRDGSQQFEVTP